MGHLDVLKPDTELPLTAIDKSDNCPVDISIVLTLDGIYECQFEWPGAPGDSPFRVRRNYTSQRYAEEFLTTQFYNIR
jgi:hypothetical protein